MTKSCLAVGFALLFALGAPTVALAGGTPPQPPVPSSDDEKPDVKWANFPDCIATAQTNNLNPVSGGKKFKCMIQVEDLHPTQFAVGMRAVREKVKKHMDDKDKRHKFLLENPIPVFVGPSNRGQEDKDPIKHPGFYPDDHHHEARAVLEAGHSTWMVAEVQADLRFMRKPYSTLDDFFSVMTKQDKVYLIDEDGKTRSADDLPKSIGALKDDELRSLAAEVRGDADNPDSKDCFRKGTAAKDQLPPFAEFRWAEFFRAERIRWDDRKDQEFEKAVEMAESICHLPVAQAFTVLDVGTGRRISLPGFIPAGRR
jgi:hypothetical protein